MNKLVSDFETLLFVSMSRFAQAASSSQKAMSISLFIPLLVTISIYENFIFISAQDGIISKPETQFYASS